MKIFEEDINNWTGLESRVYDVQNTEHMKELIQIITDRPVSIRSYDCSMFLNSDETSVVEWNDDLKELTVYREVMQGELYERLGSFKTVSNEFGIDYVYVSETALIQGHREGEDGEIEEADIVGIEVVFLEQWDSEFEYDYEDWVTASEDFVYSNFEQAHEFKFVKSEAPTYISF